MDVTQSSGQRSRLDTDADPFLPSTSRGARPRVTLPSYMEDVDLAARREGRRPQPRNDPGSERSKPILVRRSPEPPLHAIANPVYSITSRPKGLFLMINNINFETFNTRQGAEKDHENLMNLFRKLGYRVECWQDQTTEEMRTKITRFARRPELSRVDSVFVAVSSHGRREEIVSRDGDATLACDWLVGQFNATRCAGMRCKPKVFLFQLCRGESRDVAWENANAIQRDGTVMSEPGRLNEDILVANATVRGFVALRHRERGSWFLQAICKVYSQHACEDDIETMHRKVDNLIRQCKSDDRENPARQTCTYRNQGFSTFYFYPRVGHE